MITPETAPGVRIASPGEPEATVENCASGGSAHAQVEIKAPVTSAAIAAGCTIRHPHAGLVEDDVRCLDSLKSSSLVDSASTLFLK